MPARVPLAAHDGPASSSTRAALAHSSVTAFVSGHPLKMGFGGLGRPAGPAVLSVLHFERPGSPIGDVVHMRSESSSWARDVANATQKIPLILSRVHRSFSGLAV